MAELADAAAELAATDMALKEQARETNNELAQAQQVPIIQVAPQKVPEPFDLEGADPDAGGERLANGCETQCGTARFTGAGGADDVSVADLKAAQAGWEKAMKAAMLRQGVACDVEVLAVKVCR